MLAKRISLLKMCHGYSVASIMSGWNRLEWNYNRKIYLFYLFLLVFLWFICISLSRELTVGYPQDRLDWNYNGKFIFILYALQGNNLEGTVLTQ